MSSRSHLEDVTHPVRALEAAAEREEHRAAEVAATIQPDVLAGGRAPLTTRAIDGLQATAGNRAVAGLLAGRTRSHHREGKAAVHAAHGTVEDGPTVQRAPWDDEEQPADVGNDLDATTDPNALAGGSGTGIDAGLPGTSGATDAAGSTDSGATEAGTGAATPGASWTKVGPAKSSTYSVSGSLRTVATAIAARTEAGSETSSPSSDTETAESAAGGGEKVTAARVTVSMEIELPSWSDKSKATVNQQKEWDRFLTAITAHENGHAALDKAAYADVHSRMVGQTPADADKKLDAAEAKAKTDNETYDTNNDHGLKQGTGINPNIDEVTKVP